MIITQNGIAAMVISPVAVVALVREALALLKMLVHSQKAVAGTHFRAFSGHQG
jgi:hypothetical protein